MSLEGQQLGEFEILELLGQGGMGEVHKARQTSLGRFVALKTLHSSLAGDADYITRFQREARAAAVLNHPNLVQVYSAGESEGLHWFAMEYVEGESAKVRLERKGRLDPLEAIAIAIHVATALDYGWRKAALIHSDIKPDNIFLSSDGEVKLGDLGLAKSAEQTQGLTMTGASMGTPHYISPEQAEASKDIDLRADIYSLGCTLYHLLSGQPPYLGNSAVAVMMKHVRAPVPDLRSVWPKCPAELASVVGKMMQKLPAERQQNYEEVIADLRRAYGVLSHASVPALVTATQRPVAGRKPIAGKRKSAVSVAAWIGGGVAVLAAIGAPIYFAPWKKGSATLGGTRSVVSQTFAGEGGKKVGADRASPSTEATPASGKALAVATTPQPEATPAPTTPAPASRPSVSSTPAPSTPRPSVIPKPATEVERWFAQVDGPQEEAFQKQVLKPFEAGVAELRARYLAALNTANAKASATGQLMEALMWRTERQSFEKEQNVVVDAPDTPTVVKTSRTGFRQQLARLDQDRAAHAKALLAPYDAILAKNQTLLTQHQRLDDALLLKTKRDEIAHAWLGPSPLITAAPVSDSRWTDVLALVDLAAVKDSGGASTVWERTAAGIEFKKSTRPSPYISGFAVPVALARNYAIEVEFTCFSVPPIMGISVPIFERTSASGWISYGAGYAGVGKVDGNDPMANSLPGQGAPLQIHPGQRYKMRIEVRHVPEGVDLQFAVDDTVVGSYRGRIDRLKRSTAWSVPDDMKTAWVGTGSPTAFHSLRVTSLDDITTAKDAPPIAGRTVGNTPDSAAAQIPAGSGTTVAATTEQPYVNALGMKFVPVPITGGPTNGKRVLFSVWDTRVQDYEAFVAETKHEWPKTDFEQGPTYPALMVNWDDAKTFCAWLTDKERASGRIGGQDEYRLPSDHEWSCAVGIGGKEKAEASPGSKSGKIENVYPWGTQWPPPKGAGNYAGEELQPAMAAGKYSHVKGVVSGYRDDFLETAPVGSFVVNQFGLFDLGGNVWQWCEDWVDKGQKDRVLRGASWNSDGRGDLLSSGRHHYAPSYRNDHYGFRCVLAISGSYEPKLAQPPSVPQPAPKEASTKQLASATKESPFVNSLEMKFAPVPIAGGPTAGQRVLFSVWDTRIQDYEVFASETKREWPKPDFVQAPTHPAVNVSWEDAQQFCQWLTEREQTARRLPSGWRYRLPSDHEWSCATGIGVRENAAKLPVEKNGTISDAFPWGYVWPPPKGAGNYGPSLLVDKFESTSPVGSFPPNRFGLRDLGGNVWQWCEDLFGPDQKDRVLRGSSWYHNERDSLLSSCRTRSAPGGRYHDFGFRCVLDASAH